MKIYVLLLIITHIGYFSDSSVVKKQSFNSAQECLIAKKNIPQNSWSYRYEASCIEEIK